MAMGSFDTRCRPGPIAEINMVPLVDVMLVLLVIFIIAAPLLTHSIQIDLPRASSTPGASRSDHIELSIREDGALYWNAEPITLPVLDARFAAEAAKQPQAELQVRADRLARYETVARVMSAAAKAGMAHIGLVTQPRNS